MALELPRKRAHFFVPRCTVGTMLPVDNTHFLHPDEAVDKLNWKDPEDYLVHPLVQFGQMDSERSADTLSAYIGRWVALYLLANKHTLAVFLTTCASIGLPFLP